MRFMKWIEFNVIQFDEIFEVDLGIKTKNNIY